MIAVVSAILEGQNILVTGANTGIGRVTAEVLARRGATVYLACRSEARTAPVIEAIRSAGGKAEFLPLDLADLTSVRACARAFLAHNQPLHVLVNNAGLGGLRGATKDGFEMHFGTNHLGHFLLTQMLLPRMRESTPARIVNVSSKAHYRAKDIPFAALREPTRSPTGMPEYGVSKLCNVLFTKELARGRAGKGITSYALHPGVIASEIWREVPRIFRPLVTMFMKTVEQGAESTLYCATSPVCAEEDGLYYDECRAVRPSRAAEDAALAKELWQKSEEWTRGS
jgi:NAD(P)-dependent dehydrogenase (short-subunit alcohol dehydrogenase family)